MSGFTKIEIDNVTIEHYSTSSQIKITIVYPQPWEEDGPYEAFKKELWLDYTEFDDLKKAIGRTDDWMGEEKVLVTTMFIDNPTEVAPFEATVMKRLDNGMTVVKSKASGRLYELKDDEFIDK